MDRVRIADWIKCAGCFPALIASLFGACLLFVVWIHLPNRVNAAAGDELPRVVCIVDGRVTIYAEGLSAPDGLAFSPDGVLFVAEEKGGRVSRVEPYGSSYPVLSGLTDPEGITFDAAGNLYVVEDVEGGRLIKLSLSGVSTTLATERDAPEGVVWTPDGTVYITESNVQFTGIPFNFRTHVTAISPGGGATRILTNTLLWSYAGITMGPDAFLYVTNEASGTGTSQSVFKVDPVAGSRTLFVADLLSPEGLRFSSDGGFPLYVVEEDQGNGAGRLTRLDPDGSHTPYCTGFGQIEDVALDAAGRIYVSEDSTGSIVRIERDPPDRSAPRAIILFIGDGMGEVHRTAGRWSAVGQTGALAMDQMPYGGLARTASANDPVTDSAAAATALATGSKTNNGVIGLDPEGNRLITILERAQAQGWAVGLVTNVQLAHATPAAFAAHVPSRSMMNDIASQLLGHGVDVLLGGGEDEFLPTFVVGHYPEPGERIDGRNLIDEAASAGYAIVYDGVGLGAVVPVSTTRLLGLFADEGMARPYTPSLAEMTETAIDILSQDPDGFFLMVEGGQIDWTAHANRATDVIADVIGFDQAVGVAQTWAATTGDVLLIVTADHETGGLSVGLTPTGAPGEEGPFLMPGGTPFYTNWSTTSHTAADVPTAAQGPWSDLLTGSYENTTIHDVMRLALESSPQVALAQVAVPRAGLVVRPRDPITYTLTLTNSGPVDELGLVLTDTLPVGVHVVAGSVRTAPGLEPLSWTAPRLIFSGTLPAAHTLTATFGVTVGVVPSGTLLVNRVEARAQRFGSRSSTAAHPVAVIPDIRITKTAVPAAGGMVGPGESITYTIVAQNSGDLARDVVLSDTLDSANVTLVFSHTTRGNLDGPSPVRVTGFNLDSDWRVTLTLGVRVNESLLGVAISNRASLTSADLRSMQQSNQAIHLIKGINRQYFYLPILFKSVSASMLAPGRR